MDRFEQPRRLTDKQIIRRALENARRMTTKEGVEAIIQSEIKAKEMEARFLMPGEPCEVRPRL